MSPAHGSYFEAHVLLMLHGNRREDGTTMRMPLGQVLKRDGWVDDAGIHAALDLQRRWRCRFGEALLRLRLIDPNALRDVLAVHLGVQAVHIGNRALLPEVLELLPYLVIVRSRVLPVALRVRRAHTRLVVALTEPNNLPLLDDLTFAAGMFVDPCIATEEDIDQAIMRHCAVMRRDAVELSGEPAGEMEIETLVAGKRDASHSASAPRSSAAAAVA